MRHQKRGRKLGRTASHRKATLINLAMALIKHKRIKTTDAKAKETKKFIEPLITKARRGTLHDRRQVLKRFPHPDVVTTLFDEIAPRYVDRPGGYTRIVKLGFRDNDCAPVSIIELVDYIDIQSSSATKKSKKEKKPKKSVKPEVVKEDSGEKSQ